MKLKAIQLKKILIWNRIISVKVDSLDFIDWIYFKFIIVIINNNAFLHYQVIIVKDKY